MSSQNQEQYQNQIKQLSAEFFNLESNRQSLITVVDCEVSGDRKRATIYLSVLPEDKGPDALNFAKRKRGELKEYISQKSKTRNAPFVDVVLARNI